MNQIVFYHVWKEGMEFSHHWFHTNFSLKLVVENLPEKVVCKQAPHIHWIAFPDWEKERKEYVSVKLPSLHHVPFMTDPKVSSIHIEKDQGVMMPVFDFDWVYYIKSENTSSQLIKLSPNKIYLENKLTDREEWIKNYIQPSWEIFHQNQKILDLYQRRTFFSLSKVLGEWKMCQILFPLCEWTPVVQDYDKAEISYHLYSHLPLEKRKQLFFQQLVKNEEYWIEKWWDLLEYCCLAKENSIVQNQLFKKMFGSNNQEWWKDIPLGRWVPRKIVEDHLLFYQETMVIKQFYLPIMMKYLFSKVLTLQNEQSCSFFTQECTHFIKKLITMKGCENGNLLTLQDDLDFVPSSSGLMVYPENPQWYVVNIRKVNYRILRNGTYVTIKNGQINPVYNGISKNEFYFMHRDTLQPVSPIRPVKEDLVPNKREEEIAIVGLEDVRLVPGINQDVLFYGVTKSYSYSDAIRIITGKYDLERACFHDTNVIHPPYEENACEKNWTWCGNNRFIYRWNPVEIGYINTNNKLVIDEWIPSPLYFKEFRGSSPAVVWKNFHFFSVHSVAHGENGRKYIHSIVVLDLLSEKHQVIGVSPPFCFENIQIEYTISMDIYKGKILFLYSTRDCTSRYVRLPFSFLLEELHFMDSNKEILFKTQIMREDLF